jgi:hypothetical protein
VSRPIRCRRSPQRSRRGLDATRSGTAREHVGAFGLGFDVGVGATLATPDELETHSVEVVCHLGAGEEHKVKTDGFAEELIDVFDSVSLKHHAKARNMLREVVEHVTVERLAVELVGEPIRIRPRNRVRPRAGPVNHPGTDPLLAVSSSRAHTAGEVARRLGVSTGALPDKAEEQEHQANEGDRDGCPFEVLRGGFLVTGV